MLRLDLTINDPAENLALDEALLDQVESGRLGDLLRLWQFNETVVVLGRSSKIATEIQSHNCIARNVPILRRNSGGGAIVAGPGCLLYSLVLNLEMHPHLRAINVLHQWVMERIVRSLRHFSTSIDWQGICDVTQDSWKVSGNSMRLGRNAALYHGTVLCNMDLTDVEQLLGDPVRQPEYREDRPHGSFIKNLGISPPRIADAIAVSFGANEKLVDIPRAEADILAETRYRDANWTMRH